MDKAKYVIFEDGLGDEIVILFPILARHADIASSLKARLGKPIAAGFVSFQPEFHAHGNSLSLKLTSREGDSRLIASQFGMEKTR